MTWTYTGDPSASSTALVHFLVGDTDTTDQLITDEEIAYLLTAWGNPYKAAAAAARQLSARFAREVDRTVGALSIAASRRSQAFRELAAELDAQAATAPGATVGIFAGGISRADKETRRTSSDRVEPFFSREMQRAPGTETEEIDERGDEDE